MQGNTDKGKVVALVIIAALVLVRIFIPVPSYLLDGGMKAMLTHHFFHASWLHLIVNSYAVYAISSRRFSLQMFVKSYIIASLSLLCATIPTVGYSNIIYATIGLYAPPLYSRWWRAQNTRIFLVVTIAYLFIPNISAMTHIVSFAGGLLVTGLERAIKNTRTDYAKTKRR